MTPPNQKKTNWLLIWILSIVFVPLCLSSNKSGLIAIVVPVALIILNFIATLKISQSEKSDGSMPSPTQKIFMTLWLIVLGLVLTVVMLFVGCAMLFAVNDWKLR